MGVFHVFWIVQMLPNRVKHHEWSPNKTILPEYELSFGL